MNEPRITTGGKERVDKAAALLSKAFEIDPTLTYLLSSLNKSQREDYRPRYFIALLTAAALNNASIDEVDDWKSCGVLMPPGCNVANPFTLIPAGLLSVLWNIGISGCQRMFWEFVPLTDACKAKLFGNIEKYYYVFFLGTYPEARGRGLCSAMVRHYQSIATRDGLPIWMEATTEYSMKVYLRLGFTLVDELTVGKGKANADGTTCKDGPGFKIWGMIWRPTSHK